MAVLGPNKHQLRTEATQQKLLKAAERVFARFGFEAATVEQIAAEAGYTRGAFYSNFDTKEDLFFRMFEVRIAEAVEELNKRLSKHTDTKDRFNALRDFYSTRLEDKRWCILTIEFKLYALRHPQKRAKLADRIRDLRAQIPSALGKLLKKEGVGGADLELRRTALDALLSGIALERAYDPDRITEHSAQDLLSTMYDFIFSAALETHLGCSSFSRT